MTMKANMAGNGNRNPLAVILFWLARIWSLLSIAFLLCIFIGEALSDPAPVVWRTRDIIAMVFFPGGVVLGLIIAWWREGLGGIITISSMVMFYLVLYLFDGRFPRGPYFALVALPGVFFGLYTLMKQPLKGGT